MSYGLKRPGDTDSHTACTGMALAMADVFANGSPEAALDALSVRAVEEAAIKCARAKKPDSWDAKYLKLIDVLDKLALADVRKWTTRRIADGPAKTSATVNVAARQVELERDEMARLMRRDDSPLSEAEAWSFRQDVMHGRHTAALCGEHRVTIRDVERMQRKTNRLRFRERGEVFVGELRARAKQ